MAEIASKTKLAQKNPHIVIVGGGMVGITLALMISRELSHCQITLVEQYELSLSDRSQPSFDDRSTAINEGGRYVLSRAGVWPQLAADVEPIKQIEVSDRGHSQSSLLSSAEFDVDALGYVIENKRLGQVLISEVNKTSVQCIAPDRVQKLSPRQTGIELTLDSSKNILADLLVVADGANSNLREQLGIHTVEKNYQQTALIANVGLKEPHRGVAYERFTANGPIALLPITDLNRQHRASIVWTMPNNQVNQIVSSRPARQIEALQSAFGWRAGLIESIGQVDTYSLSSIYAEEQVRSRLVLIGNAAHLLHPVAGQGFNLALRDLARLVDVLSEAVSLNQGIGDLSVLQQYASTQYLDQAVTMTLTDTLVSWFSSKKLHKALPRQLGLVALNSMPGVKQQFGRRMMGIDQL